MSRKVGNSSSSSSPKIASSVKESAVTSPSVPHGGHQSMFQRDETRGNADRPVRGPGKLVPRKGPVKGNGEENLYVDQRNGDQSNGSIHAVNRRDGSDSGNLKSKNGTTKPDEAILRSDLVTSSPSERRERLATRSEPLGTEPVTQEVVRRPPQAVIQENGNEQAYKVDKEDTTPTTSAPQRRRQLLATTSAPVRLPKVELQPSLYGIIADANGDASEDSSPQSSKSDVLSQSDHTGGATCGSERSLVRTKSLPSRSFADDDGEYRRSNTQRGGRRNTHKGKENLNVRLVAHEKMSERRKKKLMREIATIQQDGTVEFDVAGSARIASNLFGPGIFDEGGEVGEEEINEEEDDILRDVPPLQIVMLIVGTRGDVQPFVAIGKHLQEYGHRVRLATHVNFRDFVMTAGLEFYPLGGDPKVLAGYMVKNKGFLPSGPGEIQVQRKQIKAIINSLLPACVAADTESGNNVPFKAQAIIANPPAYGHVHVAEYLQVPLHIFFTMPWTATSQFPHPLSRVKQPAGYRMSYQVVDSLIWWGIRSMINDFRKKKLKLRPINYFSGSQGSIAELPTGYIWSPHLVPKPRDWGPLVDVVGFCFLNLAQDYKPPKDLLQWLKAGPAPIYIGFGSLPVVDPKGMTEIIVRALEATHQRGIIFKGWGGMGDLKKVPENIFLIEDCPHDWLFKQCAAVVHHGGAGTTAAGLKAACPTTVVPFFGDQPFWGEQIHAKGVGPSPIAVDQFSFDKLVKAIEFMMKDEVKQRATEIALAMENEDGIEGAVMAFHKHLPHDTPFPVHTDVPDKSKFKMFRPLKNVYSCFS